MHFTSRFSFSLSSKNYGRLNLVRFYRANQTRVMMDKMKEMKSKASRRWDERGVYETTSLDPDSKYQPLPQLDSPTERIDLFKDMGINASFLYKVRSINSRMMKSFIHHQYPSCRILSFWLILSIIRGLSCLKVNWE